MLPEKGRDLPAAMDSALIPQEDDGAADVPEQRREKGPDIQPVKGLPVQPEIQRDAPPPRRDREGTDGRQAVMFVVQNPANLIT
jgi:hypothetical protein